MTQDITEPKVPFESAASLMAPTSDDANQIYARAKRLCEGFVVIAIAPTVLLTIAVLALAILWTLGPPVLVKQERVGKGGRIFKQLKLRLRMEGSAYEHQPMTALSRFLEDSHLADLPQLWNVLVGDMSIVGPCPESPREANIYREKVLNYELRRRARPGLFPGS